MSLIICRNRPNEQDVVGTNSSIYEPYSFRNQLTSNIEIPANSQIALQSAKINMDGSVILGDEMTKKKTNKKQITQIANNKRYRTNNKR